MTLLTDRILDHRNYSDLSFDLPYHAAFMQSGLWVSPNNRYVASVNANDPTVHVADTHTLEVIQNHNIDTLYFNPLVSVSSLDTHLACIDNDGSIWAADGAASGAIFELPLHRIATPQYRFTLASGGGGDPYWFRFANAFTLPDETTLLVFIEFSNTVPVYDYHTFNKDTGAYTHSTLLYPPHCAFQDDNGDVWVCGVDYVVNGPITSANFIRITDVTGSSPYTATQTFTGLPDLPHGTLRNTTSIWGTFANGCFVGGWGETQLGAAMADRYGNECNYLIKLNLTSGAVTATDISGTAPVGYSWGMPDAVIPTGSAFIMLQLLDATSSEAQSRDFATFSTSTLAKVTDYNLDDWAAGDDLIADQPVYSTPSATYSISHEAWGHQYLYARDAFIAQSYGTGYFSDDPAEPTQQFGKLWIYYVGAATNVSDGDGDGLTDESLRLRVWGYVLDGHAYAVFRVGPSASLIYDLTTNQWSSWESPGRDNWRAHVGQNWIGMSQATFANNLGSDVVCGDDASPALFILDPTSGRDDRATTGNDYFDREVTGLITIDGRDVLNCGAVTMSLSVGNPSQTGAEITLWTSDDLGHTWFAHETNVVAAGEYSAVVEWRGCGQGKAPGRVFKFVDNGAATRISAADLR